MKCKDKVALVTGAASGIGGRAAVRLAMEGAKLFLMDVNEAGLEKTAEEIRSSKQRSYTTVKDLQRALGTAITDLVYAVNILLDAAWRSGAAVPLPGECTVTFDFDDSIISDPKERKQMFWGYVTAGKFPFWRYLVEFEGYSEDEARKLAQEAADENRQPELSFGGGG